MAPFDFFEDDRESILARRSAEATPQSAVRPIAPLEKSRAIHRPEPTLERIRTFVRVASRGNLSVVARELGIGQSTVTRHVRELEEAVGVSLFSRTTRTVRITEEGMRYHAKCMAILQLLDQANEEARANRGANTGMVRISCTVGFGTLHLSRLIFDFQDLYPAIGVDIVLKDEQVSPVSEGIDIAIQFGALTDSSLKLRRMGQARRLLVASPRYLDMRGRPASPEMLSHHEAIQESVAANSALNLRGRDGVEHSIQLLGRLKVNHGLASREAVVRGRGIAICDEWLVRDLLHTGAAELVLPDFELVPIPISVLVVPERAQFARVRLLVEFLAGSIRKLPGISSR
jgi:DNA-binding transcriptional LysR family regulator